jgi:hypothetical protein
MAIKVNVLGAWTQTRNTLVQNLTSTMELQQNAPFSQDPASDFVQAGAQADRIQDQIRIHALSGLKQIDNAVAAGKLVKDISDLSKQAKVEADRIKNAAKTVAGITKAVDLVAGVVTKIAGLPFL